MNAPPNAGRRRSRSFQWRLGAGLLLAAVAAFGSGEVGAGEAPDAEGPVQVRDEYKAPRRLPEPDPERFPGLKRLQPDADVWIDAKNKRVVVQAGVCLREGPIELFACNHRWIKNVDTNEVVRRGTKEYESIVTINAPAMAIHAGLLAVGAESGSPVRFRPDYQPAHGSVIHVTLHWTDAEGKARREKAQQWIRNTATGEALKQDWVFAGSRTVKTPNTKRPHYLAEDGNVICVSNFSDAMLDLPIRSTQANEALMFAAFTERIPPVGTPVTVVFEPKE